MKNRLLSIKALTAWVLLVVFAFSITPRLYLHSLFANHVDESPIKSPKGQPVLAKAGFHCELGSQVATAPFDEVGQEWSFDLPLTYCPAPVPRPVHIITEEVRFSAHRGPPALG